ncbi:MAG: IS3 family transposase [Desulfobacterium sp.]|nr:IS3 family transposase [Desulfobacterium sp.]MBU3949877.1 IS3 family transposase [Pseudomonadota bacterium]
MLKKVYTNVKAKYRNVGTIGRIPYGKYNKEFREEAFRDITEYIEIFYNRQRRQARLGYLSPVVFDKQFYALKQAV